MLELEVILDFKCCNCRHKLGVTLKCAGKGLTAPGDPVAAVNVPCPTCNSINQVCFRRSGEVARVLPYREPRGIPVPSLN